MSLFVSRALHTGIAGMVLLLSAGTLAAAAPAPEQEEAARALLRPVCNDPKARAELIESLEAQEPAYRKTAVKWDFDTACAQVDLPLTPVHDTADLGAGASHSSWVYSVQWSSDGQRIVSASRDGTVRIWDAASGKSVSVIETPALRQLPGAPAPGIVRSAVFAGSGSLVLVAADAQPVVLYDTATGRAVGKVPFNKTNPNEPQPPHLAATPKGLLFMAGHSDEVVAFDTARMSVRYRLAGHAPKSTAVAVSERAGLVATGSQTNDAARIMLWKIASGERLAVIKASGSDRPSALAFSRDGTRLAVALGGAIRVYATADQALLQTIVVHPFNGLFDIAFTADGNGIISCASHPILWDIATAQLVRHFGGLTDLCHSVSVSPDGQFAVTGSMGSDVRIWEVATGRFFRRLGIDFQQWR